MRNRHSRMTTFAAPLPVAAFLAVALPARAQDTSDFPDPKLQIPIPTIKFSDITISEDGTTLTIPFLANYINGLYTYAIGIATVVAAVMAVVGGFQYLTAGGDAGKVKQARGRITDAIAGVILTLTAYALLNTINPMYVDQRGLKVSSVKNVPELTIDEPGGVETASTAGDVGDYDDVFKKYAACAGVDWRVLKAVAKKESGFKADVTNKFGFVGLFQTKAQFCSLSRYDRGDECTVEGLKNPDANTASAAGGQLKEGVKRIKSMCPDVKDTQTFVMLLYYGHNSGSGALKSVIEDVGCGASTQDYAAASSRFWGKRAVSTGRTIPNQDGRMQYAQKVAAQAVAYGVTDPFSSEGSEECPL